MKKPEPIGKEEWLASLSEASAFTGAKGATTNEIADACGHSTHWVTKYLKKLQSQGRLILGKAPRPRFPHGVYTADVFRLKPAKK